MTGFLLRLTVSAMAFLVIMSFPGFSFTKGRTRKIISIARSIGAIALIVGAIGLIWAVPSANLKP